MFLKVFGRGRREEGSSRRLRHLVSGETITGR